MGRLFLRPIERGREQQTSPGVCVTTADGRRLFFTGGSKLVALALARNVLGAELDDESVRVEWGVRNGSDWSCQEVIPAGRRGGE